MKGDKNRFALVYKVTNTLNGKCYIGVTVRNDLRRRLSEHFCHAHTKMGNGAFHRALRKHPKDVFTIETIKKCYTAYEALDEEIRLIEEMKPEYNSTVGGEAGNGGNITPEGRGRMGDASRGNQYRLGKRHTEETRKILSKHGKEKEFLFKKYSFMGPQASSRPVLCVDTGEIFPSASEAARQHSVRRSSVIELCNGYKGLRKTVGGRRYAYVENAECAPMVAPL